MTIAADAITYFDDMVNGGLNVSASSSLTISSSSSFPTSSSMTSMALLPDVYHDFFDSHPELRCGGEEDDDEHSLSSDAEHDLEMDLDIEEDVAMGGAVPVVRAHTLAEMRQAIIIASSSGGSDNIKLDWSGHDYACQPLGDISTDFVGLDRSHLNLE
ncbi:hypothetical protein EDD11_005104 [Mortierella claussenii]|nr:hypothetical protein EDD11_005104 [Mortierella claussenii]